MEKINNFYVAVNCIASAGIRISSITQSEDAIMIVIKDILLSNHGISNFLFCLSVFSVYQNCTRPTSTYILYFLCLRYIFIWWGWWWWIWWWCSSCIWTNTWIWNMYFIYKKYGVKHKRKKRIPRGFPSGNKCVRELDTAPQDEIIFPVHFLFSFSLTMSWFSHAFAWAILILSPRRELSHHFKDIEYFIHSYNPRISTFYQASLVRVIFLKATAPTYKNVMHIFANWKR